MTRTNKINDRKVQATAIIWGCATGMMAICIPLVSDSGSGVILPLAAILGTSISTISIWQNVNSKTDRLFENLSQTEQRIRDLETILCENTK